MKQTWWRKSLSVALSLMMCGSLMAPAFTGITAVAADPIKIACVGDSITNGVGASNGTLSYPAQLQTLLGNRYDVQNFGVSGCCLLSKGELPYIQGNTYTRSREFQPDYVLLMLGTNDSKPQSWAHKADFEADMKAMIEAYRNLASHPVVIIATSPTVGATNISISEAVVTNEIVPLQKKVAAEVGCPVIDINTLTKGAPQNYVDGIHPNDAGYTAMAEMFYNGLQDIFNAQIKGFAVNGVPATIDDEAGTISLTLPYGTALTAIEPTITLASGATIDKTGVQNFQSPVTYTVTSPDGKQQKTYTVTVKTAEDTDGVRATIDTFTLNGAFGVIDNDQNTVTVTLPAGTDVTALEPVLALPEGAAYSPAGVQNFTAPVKYTVTAADGTSTREYTVTVKVQAKIKVALVGDSMTAANEYPTALTEFLGKGYEVGRFGVNSTTVQKDGQKETGDKRGAYIYHPQYQQSLNFAPDIVLLTLGANDSKQGAGQTQSGYNLVTNWTENSPENFENDLKELVASYQAIGATVVLGTSPSGYDVPNNWGAKSAIVNSQIAPIQRKVAAEMGCFLSDFNAATLGKETALISGDGLHPNYNGYYTMAALKYVAIQDSLAAITDFAIGSHHAVIDQADKTIYLSVPDGTDLTALNPAVTLADGAVADKTGTQNFGQPVVYTVTAANGWTVEYEVSVTSPSSVTVSKIELLTMPSKTTYLKGKALDTTGATIAVIYTDGTREVVDVTSDMVSGYEWLKVAKQDLTVTYKGETTTFTVQVKPHGVVGGFSAREGIARVLRNGSNLLYADWRWADQYPMDLSDGAGNPNPNLSLEMDITFGSDREDVDPSNMWNWLIVKLRSTDKADVPGDPEKDTGNREHNYGWQRNADTFADPGSIHISIPLKEVGTQRRGVMNWSEVDRLILQCNLTNMTNTIDHYMDIRNIYIVDNSQIPEAPDTEALQTAVTAAEKVDTTLYTAETVAAFTAALNTAKAYLENPYAAQTAVDAAIDALAAATEGLEEKPAYVLGNVDMDEENAITASDALLALQAATGKVTLDETQTTAADVDGNEGVTASDALMILQYATKKITTFH